MAFPGFNILRYYATPPNNHIGTFIFLSYIILALSTTLSIISSLYIQYTTLITHAPVQNEKVRTSARRIKIFALLAYVSFTMLSYHMLFYLITHYYASTDTISATGLKDWMLDSTLFRDFALELVSARGNAVVTHVAILETWFWGVWMGRKGALSPLLVIALQRLVVTEGELTSSSAATQPPRFDDDAVHLAKSNPTNKLHRIIIHNSTTPLLRLPYPYPIPIPFYPITYHRLPLPPRSPPKHHSTAPPDPLSATPRPLHIPRLGLARYPAVSVLRTR